MKTYIATYYRHNPQLSSGGYQTTRKIEAVFHHVRSQEGP